jgi:hypothetical protein
MKAIVIFAATYLFAAVLYTVITALAAGERARAFKGISPSILPPLAIVFALPSGFYRPRFGATPDRANTAVNREASALRAVVLLATGFPMMDFG